MLRAKPPSPRRALLALALALFGAVASASAQSPNTAAMLVVVVDQSGGVVPDAEILVTNAATGATRALTSGNDGAATVTALSLTGTYMVRRHEGRLPGRRDRR